MKKKYALLFASYIFIIASVAFAQSNVEQGDEAFRYGYYKTAIDHYLHA